MKTAPPPDDDDDIDDETVSAFEKVFKKYHGKNPEWLKTLFPDFSLPVSKPAAGDLTTFLQTLLAEQKETAATTTAKLEMALSLMSPEQLTLLRSQSSGGKSGEPSGGKGGAPGGGKPMSENDPPPPPPTKPRKWL